ncbi:PREDICTED: uncharacterized protein LOC107335809 [Acropora digitifera]|uniref:uncharacterized protein LOC107335809 n=1 Tax=Acropora digitifera TaxID=70779 RepID=UPI00077B1597|nr:PREDICTED: uncharacterized protein LOC107335809 [Acropora digitifera]
MQGDNKAVQYRAAHLQWLLDSNNAFALNSADEWQLDLCPWTPSSSARYPIRLKEPKPLTDPEAVPEDYRVHVYHSKQDRMWVQQWIIGMLQANRFNVTTNKQSSRNGSRVILVLTLEPLNEVISEEILGAIIFQGKQFWVLN